MGMIDRLPGIGLLNEIRRIVVRTRPETPQERENSLDSLFQQIQQEEIGSARYDNVFTAYRWLKRQPERNILVVFGKDTPFWF